MIIVNGKLRAIIEQAGTTDNNGIPQPATESLADNTIYCNIKVNGREFDARTAADTSYTSANFTLLIDDFSFDADIIELKDIRNNPLGRCHVTDIQRLDCVQAVQVNCVRYADNAKW